MSMDEHDDQAIEEAINATLETLTEITKGYDPRPKYKRTNMNEHIEVIMQCAAKFPELRFGQFLLNAYAGASVSVMDDQRIAQRLYYVNDRDLAEHCKSYCKEQGR